MFPQEERTAAAHVKTAVMAPLFSTVLFCMALPSWANGDPVSMQSMRDFLQGTPDCVEFTDKCSICRVSDGQAMCSTPSTACIKKAYVCTRRSAD